MTDPSLGIDWNTVGMFTGGFIGTTIGAVALRMGWKSAGTSTSPGRTEALEITSAIVDSSSIKLLAASIEGLSFNLLAIKKVSADTNEENQRLLERLIEILDTQGGEVRQLGREIREHAREIARVK